MKALDMLVRYGSPFKTHLNGLVKAATAGILIIGSTAAAGCRFMPVKAVDASPTELVTVDIDPAPAYDALTEITAEPTAVPTAEPVTIEEKLLAGIQYPLDGGNPIDGMWTGEYVDIDGDGTAERLHVADIDGGPVFCIDDEPFMDVGSKITLASLDGKNIVFITEKVYEPGFSVFYPDEDGNLYCRLFAVSSEGHANALERCSSYEEYIEAGLEIILENPMLYSKTEDGLRFIELDMNLDGKKDEISFDSTTLSVNGRENQNIMKTTMPRFRYDAERDSIVIYGSAGDFALSLRLDGRDLVENISHPKLL